MHSHDKLFIPGPVEVSEKTWAAFSRPLIGHRSDDFKESLPRHSSKAPDIVRNEAAGVPFHVVGVGRDGSVHP